MSGGGEKFVMTSLDEVRFGEPPGAAPFAWDESKHPRPDLSGLGDLLNLSRQEVLDALFDAALDSFDLALPDAAFGAPDQPRVPAGQAGGGEWTSGGGGGASVRPAALEDYARAVESWKQDRALWTFTPNFGFQNVHFAWDGAGKLTGWVGWDVSPAGALNFAIDTRRDVRSPALAGRLLRAFLSSPDRARVTSIEAVAVTDAGQRMVESLAKRLGVPWTGERRTESATAGGPPAVVPAEPPERVPGRLAALAGRLRGFFGGGEAQFSWDGLAAEGGPAGEAVFALAVDAPFGSPDQPRLPAGQPGGGEWTSGGGGGAGARAERKAYGRRTAELEAAVERAERVHDRVTEASSRRLFAWVPEADPPEDPRLLAVQQDLARAGDVASAGAMLAPDGQQAAFRKALKAASAAAAALKLWGAEPGSLAAHEVKETLADAVSLQKLVQSAARKTAASWQAVLDATAALEAHQGDAPFYSPDQPRVPAGQPGGGRWTGGVSPGTSAARDAASDAVRAFTNGQGPPTAAEAEALAGHLAKLTVAQIHALKAEHGLKGSAPNKAALVAKMAGRFAAWRAGRAPKEAVPDWPAGYDVFDKREVFADEPVDPKTLEPAANERNYAESVSTGVDKGESRGDNTPVGQTTPTGVNAMTSQGEKIVRALAADADGEPAVDLGGQPALRAAMVRMESVVPGAQRGPVRERMWAAAHEAALAAAVPTAAEAAALSPKLQGLWEDAARRPSFARVKRTGELTWGERGYQDRLEAAVAARMDALLAGLAGGARG